MAHISVVGSVILRVIEARIDIALVSWEVLSEPININSEKFQIEAFSV